MVEPKAKEKKGAKGLMALLEFIVLLGFVMSRNIRVRVNRLVAQNSTSTKTPPKAPQALSLYLRKGPSEKTTPINSPP